MKLLKKGVYYILALLVLSVSFSCDDTCIRTRPFYCLVHSIYHNILRMNSESSTENIKLNKEDIIMHTQFDLIVFCNIDKEHDIEISYKLQVKIIRHGNNLF